MAQQIPQFTVKDAMAECGVEDDRNHDGQTQAGRIAGDMFSDTFATCMDKTFDELDSDFKTFSGLSVQQGQIRLLPGTKTKIKAFVQWSRDQIRLGMEPSTTRFPVAQTAELIRRYKTHSKFVYNSTTLSDAAKPRAFTDDMAWKDWETTLVNYLRLIPGRDGVPLSYVIRPNDIPNAHPNADFLDDYVQMAPLAGEAFVIDAAQVHTFITSFISGNETAEAKIQMLGTQTNGRRDFQTLTEYYEGVGIHAIDIAEADQILSSLHYSGEKRPHMWWDEFEKKLMSAFVAYEKKEGRVVYSNDMKLRILVNKIKSDALMATKAGINIELAKQPMTMTFELAIASFRNEVNRANPPQLRAGTRTPRRHINASNRDDSSRRSYHKAGGSYPRKPRSDSKTITLTDGERIEYHASFNFPRHVYKRMKEQDKATLKKERTAYKNRKYGTSSGGNAHARELQELKTRLAELKEAVSARSIAAVTVPQAVCNDQQTQVSQVTQQTSRTMMGGRNDQAAQRGSERSQGATSSHRKIASVTHSASQQPSSDIVARNECDTNADTCCLGTNFTIMEYTSRVADVYGYDKSGSPAKDVPIVTGATAYDNPIDGNTYILVFHESLYYGTQLDHSLLNPNQLRYYGAQVYDNPFDTTRENPLLIETPDGVTIPLQTKGTKIFFDSRSPTHEELLDCPHIHCTSKRPWNPDEVVLKELNRSKTPTPTDE